jgi:hypothetical protein
MSWHLHLHLHHLAVVVLSLAGFWAIWSQVVAACSYAHSFLPPWEFLNDFPTAQKLYKVFVYLVGYVAGNFRSSVYQSLSTQNGTVPSKASQTAPNGGGGNQP